jgi:diacylglycerol kinase family enzyme
MKVWVLHSSSAGRSVSPADLRGLIEDAGHTVVDTVESADLERSLELDPEAVDLAVAAGGDGTVAKAARLAAAASIPLAILPLGTANNIAVSLGLIAPIPALVRGWDKAVRTPFDLGHARAGSTEWLVLEGVGCGWVPAGIAATERRLGELSAALDPGDEVAFARRAFRAALEDLAPHPWTIVADGQTWTGEFLAIEILNIPLVGPRLILSRAADPSDGRFDLLLAREADRTALLAHVDARLAGSDCGAGLPVHHVGHVTITSCGDLHVNDEPADACGLGEFSLRVAAGALTVLRPGAARSG